MQRGFDKLTESVKQGNMLMWAAGNAFTCFKVTRAPMGVEQKWLGQIDRRLELTPFWLVLL